MKGQVDDPGLAERESFEVSFSRLVPQENGPWFG